MTRSCCGTAKAGGCLQIVVVAQVRHERSGLKRATVGIEPCEDGPRVDLVKILRREPETLDALSRGVHDDNVRTRDQSLR